MVEPASIEISDLRPRDEGWYECSVVFLNGPVDEQIVAVNGSWLYLAINGLTLSLSLSQSGRLLSLYKPKPP
jgi:hypothetical protein